VTRISSNRARFLKRAFPVFWFGIVGVVLLAGVLSGTAERAPLALVAPVVMAGVGYALMRGTLLDLADEVFDCGDYLLVRMRGEEERVPLGGVMNVSASTLVNPPRITLRLVAPGRFGTEISFAPITPFSLNPFARNRIADDLIVRVDRARRRD
jgi:hypothetical protein